MKTDPAKSSAIRFTTIGLPVLAALLLAAIAAYWSILNNTLLGDDFSEIARLYHLPVSELWRLFSVNAPAFLRPVPYLMFWLQYRFFGLEALPSHLLSVCLHTGSSFLLFWFLARNGIARLAAFMAASLFVLTPLAPEAVTWSDGRFDAAVLFFLMLTLVLYALNLRTRSRWVYSAALIAAITAFLSKESGIILLVLLPAQEILFSIFPVHETGFRPTRPEIITRIKKSVLRLVPFFIAIGFFFVLRFPVLGGIGGYKNVRQFGMPNLGAPARTLLTLMAPLDRLEFSRATIVIMATCVGILYLIGAGLVIIRWNQATGLARRMIGFFTIFFIVSLLPVYNAFFMVGMNSYLTNSRFFYVPNVAFITILVLALYEFGWHSRNWRIAVTVALALLLPIYFWGLNGNNRVWEHTAAISYSITTDVPRQLPDPPENAIIYFQNVPIGEGAHFYANGLPGTITMIYNRPDIQVFYVDPEPQFRVNYAAVYGGPPADGYVFSYNRDTGEMLLVRDPISP